ncbi:hypothetical protein SEA_AJAY_66 [Mycobacterium phage Ajay]|nr:hypothetical protein SEA_AJAY_66 [Mycobacterium phage Ajay]
MTDINIQDLVDLIYVESSLGVSASVELVEKVLEKFDITEKPDPIGLITVSGDDSQAFRAITIKVAKSEWIDIFLDADQPERATVQRRKTPVGTSLDREVFRP